LRLAPHHQAPPIPTFSWALVFLAVGGRFFFREA
jgi:hypothetical protein